MPVVSLYLGIGIFKCGVRQSISERINHGLVEGIKIAVSHINILLVGCVIHISQLMLGSLISLDNHDIGFKIDRKIGR